MTICLLQKPIVKVLKKNNLVETQEKVFKIANMNMSKNHKENIKKLNKGCEHTVNEVMKTIQNVEVEKNH